MLLRVADALAAAGLHPVHAIADVAGKYDDLGIPTIADDVPGRGPVGGLLAAICHAADLPNAPTHLLLTACDLPRIEPKWLEAIRRPLEAPDPPAAVCFAADGSGPRYEPLMAIYAVSLLDVVKPLLETSNEAVKGPSLHAVLDRIAATDGLHVLPPPAGGIPSANRPADLGPHAG